jgi:AraC-like DNA-binding protein
MNSAPTSLTVHIPLRLARRGGRKQVVSPEGTPVVLPAQPRPDTTLVKALARAHRWQGLLESGAYGSIEELAKAERINPSYLARILRLTLLAPALTEAILDGRHDPERVTLERLMRPFPVVWGEQGF